MARAISLSLPGNLGIIVFGIFMISMLYTTLKLIATVIRIYKFHQLLSQSIVSDHELYDVFDRLRLGGMVVVIRDGKSSAFCFGVQKPKIFITTGLIATVDRKELEIILRHEKYHLEHNDNLVLLLATFIIPFFPFFPIFTDLIRIYRTDQELLADRAALQDEADKYSLSSIFKKLLRHESVRLSVLAPAIADLDTLEIRMKSLLSIKVDYRKLGKRNMLLSMVFITTLIVLMGTPINAVELHGKGVDVIAVCNKNVRCESVCRGDGLIKSQWTPLSYSSKNLPVSNNILSIDK